MLTLRQDKITAIQISNVSRNFYKTIAGPATGHIATPRKPITG
ncbi:hypothetical protein Z948_101 [Sulfitobacter donghicola DSW-25 = KCTC 12864 = JCM 14565]|nr:hypothetical protein Z948_101 [Sulfitobacter donghicola DSW-25 = KCTC 12864 = JCM 14565]